MTRLLRSMVLVIAAGCGVEDYGKDLPVTQVPVDPPPPPPSPGALSLVVEGGRIQTVVGKPALVKVRVPDREKLASVLTITLESPPPGFRMSPANLAVGKDAADLTLSANITTPNEPEVVTFALTSVRGEEGRVSVPVEVAGRPGTQDMSFSYSTQVKLGSSTVPPALVLDPVGRTLLSGAEQSSVMGSIPRAGVARLQNSGGLDFTFTNEVGSLGIVHFTPNPPLQNESVYAISVDDTSRVYGAVSAFPSAAANYGYVQRLHPSGLVDTTFAGGSVRFSDPSLAYGVVADRDGVVVCGQERQNGRAVAFLNRYNTDGKVDPLFASDWLTLDTRVNFAQNLVRAPGGRFAFTGQGPNGYLVFLVEVDGVPVATFGDRGTAVLPYADWTSGIAGLALTNDAVFVSGPRNSTGLKARIVKLGRDGVRVPSFGKDGELLATATGSAPATTAFSRFTVDGLGRLVTVGRTTTGALVLERWTANGSADTTFGSGGRVQIAGANDSFQAVEVRPNGRILVLVRLPNLPPNPPTLQVTQFWD